MTKSREPRCESTDIEDLEKDFWGSLDHSSPLYGSDTPGSLFSERDKAGQWDLRHLDSCLRDGMGNLTLEGINSPYLYFGSHRTMFAWHVEDYNMASINFQHYGAPKVWYGISRKVKIIFSLLFYVEF